MELRTLRDYIEMAIRRKWWIIIPFIACVGLSFGFYKRLPKIYKATTLILVQPQEVPEDYIKPTVKSLISERLNTLSQQILSRTQLEKAIKEFSLYPGLFVKLTMEEIVEVMRKAIEIKVQSRQGRGGQNTFTISYQGNDPRKVMMVTNRLAALFIEENLRAREKQAVGTSEFIGQELSVIEVTLKAKEKDIRAFKERYMGELPQQLDANLRILSRLQDQLNNNNDTRKAAEGRRMMLERELLRFSKQGTAVASAEVVAGDSDLARLNQLKEKLDELQSMYTDKHPDVIKTKAKMVRLEKEVAQQGDSNKGANSARNLPVFDPSIERFRGELAEVKLEISRLKVEGESLRKQIVLYQRRVENTPKREEELATLTRDYDLLKANYQSLLDKRIQAKMAENLERRQMGEQFRVLDLARLPEKPFKANARKIMFTGTFLGLILGFGLALTRESMDRSFYEIEDVEKTLGFPVIATLPRVEILKAKSAKYE